MKHLLLPVIAVAFVGCGEPISNVPAAGSFPAPGDECAEPDVEPLVHTDVATVGLVSNSVVIDGELAWIVQSGTNTIGRYELDSGAFLRDFIDVGNDHNPWDLAAHGGRIYVTNLLTDTITVADRATGSVLFEVGGTLEAPAGVSVGGGFMLVANSNYVGWGPASVTVFRVSEGPPYAEEVVNLRTSALNATEVLYDATRSRFYVVSTGSRDGAHVTSDGAVDVVDATLLQTDPAAAMVHSIPILRVDGDPTSAGPGSIALSNDGTSAYVASAASPKVFKIDLDTLDLLRGSDDPIVAYDGNGAQLTHIDAGPGDTLLVTAFNLDSLFVLDTTCDYTVAGPFGLGVGVDLEGPVDVSYDVVRDQALIPMSRADSLTVVSFP